VYALGGQVVAAIGVGLLVSVPLVWSSGTQAVAYARLVLAAMIGVFAFGVAIQQSPSRVRAVLYAHRGRGHLPRGRGGQEPARRPLTGGASPTAAGCGGVGSLVSGDGPRLGPTGPDQRLPCGVTPRVEQLFASPERG
jgi:hypothetical protein